MSRQDQVGGDHAEMVQANRDVIIQNGLTIEEALVLFREIALDQRPPLLAPQREEWSGLIDELSQSVIDRIVELNPDASKNFSEIRTQIAIGEAQHAYATTPDKDLLAILTELVVETAGETARSFRDIIYRQCIDIAPKLTNAQLNTLTIIVMNNRTAFPDAEGPHDLLSNMSFMWQSYFNNIVTSANELNHMASLGCGVEFQLRPDALGGPRIVPIKQLFEANRDILYGSFLLDDFVNNSGIDLVEAGLIKLSDVSRTLLDRGENEPLRYRLTHDFVRRMSQSEGTHMLPQVESDLRSFIVGRRMSQSDFEKLMAEKYPDLYSMLQTLDEIDAALFQPSAIGRTLAYVTASAKRPNLRDKFAELLLEESERPATLSEVAT